MGQQHVLVASMGTGKYGETTYKLDDGRSVTTNLTQIALGKLLAVDEILILLTEQAREAAEREGYFDRLEAFCEDSGTKITYEAIPDVQTKSDVDTVLDRLVSWFTDDVDREISLDITHAFRSLPLVFFVSLSYLDALDELDVEGIYYGQYRRDGESPLVELTYLFTLVQWHYALESFERTGSLRGVTNLLNSRKQSLLQEGDATDFSRFVDALTQAEEALDAGLPLEAGLEISRTLDAVELIDEETIIGPEGAVLEPLQHRLEPFGITQQARASADIKLDEDELTRQADLVEFYYENGRFWLALQCGQELFINRIMYERNERDDWLKESKRTRVTRDLNKKRISLGGQALELWNNLTGYFEYYSEAGFKQEDPLFDVREVEKAISKLTQNIDNSEYWEGS